LRYCRSRFFTFLFFMQKLTGTSSGKNNKSCGIFHNETNKLGFAFFCFFYNFLCNLQKSGKTLHYLSYQIARRPSERNSALQCGPWGGRPARLEQFPVSSSPAWQGKGVGRVYGLLGLGLGTWLGRGAASGAGTPAAREGARRGCLFRRGVARGWTTGGGVSSWRS
jgi:hypothetical protein